MKTVLIIEDETQTRNIFLKCLAFEGFRAVGARDGATGMAIASDGTLQLVAASSQRLIPPYRTCTSELNIS